MPPDRAGFRNVHILDACRRPGGSAPLGGLCQNGSITTAAFLDMLAIVLPCAPVRVRHVASGRIVERAPPTRLETGCYEVLGDSVVRVTPEPWYPRVCAAKAPKALRDKLMARDGGRCVVTGADEGAAVLEAALVFPVEREALFLRSYGRNIAEEGEDEGINSCRNALLLRRDIHRYFDQYLFSINPDDNYKIVSFVPDLLGLDGRTLSATCRAAADTRRVSDDLLRWHFRQSVLANVRGGGEPVLASTSEFRRKDMLRQIREGPYAKERFELEMAARLHGFYEPEV